MANTDLAETVADGLKSYTAFCKESNGTGTTWIQGVKAPSYQCAVEEAVRLCSLDWESDPQDVTCVGMIEGDVVLLHWIDIDCD